MKMDPDITPLKLQ